MLTKNEREFIRKKYEGEELPQSSSMQSQYKDNIRKKTKEAIEDLSFIAENVTEKEFKEIFTENKAGELIKNLLLPERTPTNFEELLKKYKSRAHLGEKAEECLQEWRETMWRVARKPLQKYFEEYTRSKKEMEKALNQAQARGISQTTTFGEVLERYDKEVHTEERILRNCYKWRSKGEIAQATDLSKEIVNEKVEKLLNNGKLKKQTNGWRYKKN